MFDLSNLAPEERLITEQAIARTSFHWNLLKPKLQAEKNKASIPVEWVDLSRYAQSLSESKSKGGHNHIHENDDVGHPIEFRNRVLGLAWYSGKISVEKSLVSEPVLAQEVFLSEVAHMVDFFYMSEEQRKQIFLSYHGGDASEHGHDWFDKGTYWEWIGESFMNGFVKAYSDVPVAMDNFTHKTTDEVAAQIRDILKAPFGALRKSKVFHRRNHWAHVWDVEFADKNQAQEERRACKVCKP